MLHVNSLIKRSFPSHIENFLTKCAAQNIPIAIPRTTLFEFENNQSKLRKDEVSRLDETKALFGTYGIGFEQFVSEEKVPTPNLTELVMKVGAKCTVVDATLEDFQIANRKACLKEAPHPEAGISDEMRDLVIWQTALRLAQSHGGGLLISRDVVHTHHRGDEEATAHGLLRADTFSRAEDALNIETDSGRPIKELILSKWVEIVDSALPVHKNGQIISIKEATFVNNSDNTTEASADLVLRSGAGQSVSCNVAIILRDGLALRITFSNIREGLAAVDGNVVLNFGQLTDDATDIEERLNDLRMALGVLE
jgi:hypothetical protein